MTGLLRIAMTVPPPVMKNAFSARVGFSFQMVPDAVNSPVPVPIPESGIRTPALKES
jgi:hypothetical protein